MGLGCVIWIWFTSRPGEKLETAILPIAGCGLLAILILAWVVRSGSRRLARQIRERLTAAV
jgi:hypothetical protein